MCCCGCASGDEGVRLRPEDVVGKGTTDDSASAGAISSGQAGVGWDTVIRGSLASIGLSVVNNVPAEIAYFTIRGLQMQYGLSTWESFINVRRQCVIKSTCCDVPLLSCLAMAVAFRCCLSISHGGICLCVLTPNPRSWWTTCSWMT